MAKVVKKQDNVEAMETLKENGIKIVPQPSGDDLNLFYEKGKEARRLMAGNLYSMELVEEVENALIEFRQKQSTDTKKGNVR